jgi:hypothetical protein
MAGLWRNDPETAGGKYLVLRRDGTVPEWPNFIIGAKDPCAHAALQAYAEKAQELGMDHQYVMDVYAMASEFESYRIAHGNGDPDAPRYRIDDPEIVAKMNK